MVNTKQLVQTITKGIQEKKGNGIVIADLSNICPTAMIIFHFLMSSFQNM